jgi:predicted Zn finger-like uncharacterized protein
MDVTCPRCQTDYEFDDALVSERGTTVKCTNCGHQFRVFRPKATAGGSGASPELWRIEARGGEPLELRSLVELQRAIRAGRVSRDDLLRRGDAPARRVGDIPELEPFFPMPRANAAPNTLPLPSVPVPGGPHAAEAPSGSPRGPAQTPLYGNRAPSVPPPRQAPVAPQAPRVTERPIAPGSGGGVAPPRAPTPLNAYPPPSDTLPQAAHRPKSVPPPRPAPRAPDPELDPPTVRRTDGSRSQHPPPGSAAYADTERAGDDAHDLGRGAVPPSTRPGPTEGETITQSVPPPRGESYDSLFPEPPKRKSNVGVVVGLLALAALVGVGATVGRPYLTRLTGGAPPSPSANGAPSDRLQRELAAGDRARADGDFAGAREAYLRATVVDEKALGAWDGLCTADAELAMAHWIAAFATKSALERDQAASIGASAGKSCARWADLARVVPDGAKNVATDLRPVRALATQSDGPGVRVYLPSHPGNAVVEALAYLSDAPRGDAIALAKAQQSAVASLARAELDKLEAPSDLALVAWAASVGGNPARSAAALASLEKRAPRHALLETLRAASVGDAGASPAESGPPPSVSPPATASGGPLAAAPTGGAAAQVPGGVDPGGDYRALNEKGHKALAGGEVTKAESYFKAALAQHPGDVDALYGLGQIARSRGDHPAAISYFKQVLDASAGFAPARLALADEQWSIGDKAAAAKNYELYLERVSEGSGAERARSRLGKGTDTKLEPKPEATP